MRISLSDTKPQYAEFAPELTLMPDDANLNAIVITDKSGAPAMKQMGTAKTLIEIPAEYIRKNNKFSINL